jgi:putative transposase
VALLAAQMLRTCEEHHFEVLAYCFMPDHLHLLLEGLSDDADMRSCCRLLRQRLAHAYAGLTGRPLWQPGYWDRVLRAGEETRDCALYILANPIRRGLARTIGEYPYSGGTWFLRLANERSGGDPYGPS